jgi:hypothetical protein
MSRIIPKMLSLALVFMLSSLCAVVVHAQAMEQEMIDLVAQSEEFVDWLPQYPGWIGYAYGPDENGVWYVEFYDQAEEEWLGYANVDDATQEIIDSFAPKPLPAEEYQAGRVKVEMMVLDDPEVQGQLGNPALWEVETDYNRWDAIWEVNFYRGLEALTVSAYLTEEYFTIEEIVDPNALDAEAALEEARNRAIELAYSAEGIDVALNGHDDWITYTEHQGGAIWSVGFAAGDKALFYALVDLDRETVVESSVGG